MVTQALLVALGYFFVHIIDHVFSWGVFSRPIVTGPVIGLLLGDLETGIIVGGFLEAIYMGVFSVGGVAPADACVGTVLATSFAILGGADNEAAVALAVPIGAALAPMRQVTSAIGASLNPYFVGVAKSGKTKKFSISLILYSATLGWIVNGTIIFLSVAFGVEYAAQALAQSPAWLLNGLSVSGGLLAVVGLSMLATYIWSAETGIFIVVGFILYQYLGLSPLVIAVIGTIIAVLFFNSDKRLLNLQKDNSGSEDLYV